MYQSNDDVEFVTPRWPKRFVDVLNHSSVAANFGIVGATDLNNPIVMTQSFVHRYLHLHPKPQTPKIILQASLVGIYTYTLTPKPQINPESITFDHKT